MRIILTQKVAGLGSLGDEVNVKDGYARNFLLPRGMAMLAGGKNAKAIEHRRLFLEKQRAEAIDMAQTEAEKVEALNLVVKAKVGRGGRLFGSVTNRDLHAQFTEHGFEVDRKSIALHAPVKSLGTFGATVKLHTDVKVEIQFRVESDEVVEREGAEGEAAAEEATGPEATAADATAPEAAAAEASGEHEAAAGQGEPTDPAAPEMPPQAPPAPAGGPDAGTTSGQDAEAAEGEQAVAPADAE